MVFTPVQMIGTQRSGSNLLRLMLNQLNGVSAPHPPHILERFMPVLSVYGDLANPANFARLVDDVCLLVEYNPVPWTGVVLNRDEIIRSCKLQLLTEIARVIYERKAESEGAHIWICKSMANIRYTEELEKYEVKPLYLHLFRDGRDVALSFKKAIVGEKHIYHIARQWKEEQDASLALLQKLGLKRVIQIRYEDLLTQPRNEVARLCSFIGAEYSDLAMEYHKSEESRETANSGLMWENVVKPVLSDNHHKFLKELSDEDILIFEQVAGDTLEALGYTRYFPDATEYHFSESEIADFTVQNEKLKKEARIALKPEDLEKRHRQESLLNTIRKQIMVQS